MTDRPPLPEFLLAQLLDLLDGSRDEQRVRDGVEALCAAEPEHADALRAQLEQALADNQAPQGSTTAHLRALLGRSTTHDSTRAPDWIGPYRILESIGEGGMGEVYKAERREPVRQVVALKVIKQGLATKDVLARFELERRALAAMSHGSIARVFDAGATVTGEPYFVMELVEGLPITDYCDKHKLSLPERLGLFQQVCAAVQHAHQKGIVHRDLKPGNVFVVREGDKAVAKVLDFGLAKATNRDFLQATLVTERDRVMGTPEYMAPEQAAGDGEVIDVRADIYSLGVMLYELLTGTLPFSTEDLRRAGMLEAFRLIREVDPPKPSTKFTTSHELATEVAGRRRISISRLTKELRGDLDWIVLKALAKEPERRYDAAASFAADIGRYLKLEPVEAGPPSWRYRFRKFYKRNRRTAQWGSAAFVMITLTILMGIASGYLNGLDAGLLENRIRETENALHYAVAKRAGMAADAARQVSEFMEATADSIQDHFESNSPPVEAPRLQDLQNLGVITSATDTWGNELRLQQAYDIPRGWVALVSGDDPENRFWVLHSKGPDGQDGTADDLESLVALGFNWRLW